jgi:molybdenum cofactor synthesis domain-containing protein
MDLCAERGWELADYRVVADEFDAIAAALIEACDVHGVDVVFTCGGTGLSPRDVTPEATRSVAPRPVPGIAEHIRAESLKITPRAMLSRAVAAQRGTTLIINLPGSRKAATESFSFVAAQLEHAREMAAGGGHG